MRITGWRWEVSEMLKQLQVSKPDGTGRGKRGTLWGKKYDSDHTKGYEWELLENGDVCTRSQREHTVFSECLSVCFSQHGKPNPCHCYLSSFGLCLLVSGLEQQFSNCVPRHPGIVATSLQSLPQGAHGWMSEVDRLSLLTPPCWLS